MLGMFCGDALQVGRIEHLHLDSAHLPDGARPACSYFKCARSSAAGMVYTVYEAPKNVAVGSDAILVEPATC